MPGSHRPSSFVPRAKIIREWGIKGSLKALPLSPGLSLIKPQDAVWIAKPSGIRERRTIISLKAHGKYVIISLDGVHDVESAQTFRNAVLETDAGELPLLEEGEFYHDQIIGLSVLTAGGRRLGTVAEIFSTGSNDVYVVRGSGKEFLIPAIRDVVRKIDLEEKTIRVEEIEGLLD